MKFSDKKKIRFSLSEEEILNQININFPLDISELDSILNKIEENSQNITKLDITNIIKIFLLIIREELIIGNKIIIRNYFKSIYLFLYTIVLKNNKFNTYIKINLNPSDNIRNK